MGPKLQKVDDVSHEQRAANLEEELMTLKAVAARASVLKTTISSSSAKVASLKADLALEESLLSTANADLASLNDQNDQAAKKLAVVEYQTQLEEVAYICIYTSYLSFYMYIYISFHFFSVVLHI